MQRFVCVCFEDGLGGVVYGTYHFVILCLNKYTVHSQMRWCAATVVDNYVFVCESRCSFFSHR